VVNAEFDANQTLPRQRAHNPTTTPSPLDRRGAAARGTSPHAFQCSARKPHSRRRTHLFQQLLGLRIIGKVVAHGLQDEVDGAPQRGLQVACGFMWRGVPYMRGGWKHLELGPRAVGQGMGRASKLAAPHSSHSLHVCTHMTPRPHPTPGCKAPLK